MKAQSVKQRSSKFFRWILLALLAGALVFLLVREKETLKNQSLRLLESCIKQDTELDLKIGRVSGNIFGYINFQNVALEAPWLPAAGRTVFKAKSIQFRYRFLDLISKQFNSKIVIFVDRPEMHLTPIASLRWNSRFPFIKWMRDWALTQRRHLKIEVKNLEIIYGLDKKDIKGIDMLYENNSVSMNVPLNHMNFLSSDVSTSAQITGQFEPGTFGSKDAIRGEIKTEGTVINWTPLPWEFECRFTMTEDSLRVDSANFLGGLEMSAELDAAHDETIDMTVKASNYPVSNLQSFFKLGQDYKSPVRLDLDIHFSGNFYAPAVKARARVYDGWVSKSAFKALDINVEGIYPTIKLEGSRILLEDGQTMRLADKTLEVSELFKGDTYKILVSEATQDRVVMGDWEFSRPKNLSEEPDFMLKKGLGESANVHFRQYNETTPVYDSDPSAKKQMEVGLEYKLPSQNSLKLEFRENEEIVGVQRKLTF